VNQDITTGIWVTSVMHATISSKPTLLHSPLFGIT